MRSNPIKISIIPIAALFLLSACSSDSNNYTIKEDFASHGYLAKKYKNNKVPGMVVTLFNDGAKVVCPQGFHIPNGYNTDTLHEPQKFGEYIVRNLNWTKGNTWDTVTLLVYKGGHNDASRMNIDDNEVYNTWDDSAIAFYCVADKLSNNKIATYSVKWNDLATN